MPFSKEERQQILGLARQSIEFGFKQGAILDVNNNNLPTSLQEIGACFVTLTISGRLRGCVGHLEAVQPLYLDVIENAKAAAFEDYRFEPLTKDELNKIKIEISVLTKPMAVSVGIDCNQSLRSIRPGIDGVIIRRGSHSATYLPQVWKELPKQADFLSSLCLKAGLAPDDWTKPGMEFWRYKVEKFGE